jgi:hypothetical protein
MRAFTTVIQLCLGGTLLKAIINLENVPWRRMFVIFLLIIGLGGGFSAIFSVLLCF